MNHGDARSAAQHSLKLPDTNTGLQELLWSLSFIYQPHHPSVCGIIRKIMCAPLESFKLPEVSSHTLELTMSHLPME